MPDPAQPMTVAIAEPVRTIHPEALLRLDVVCEIIGLSSSAIYRRMAEAQGIGGSDRGLAGGAGLGVDRAAAGC